MYDLSQRLAEKKQRANERREKLKSESEEANWRRAEEVRAKYEEAASKVQAEQDAELDAMRVLMIEKETKARTRQLEIKRENDESARLKQTAADSNREEVRQKAEVEYEREVAELRTQIAERERKVGARQIDLKRIRDEAEAKLKATAAANKQAAASAAAAEPDEDAETRELVCLLIAD